MKSVGIAALLALVVVAIVGFAMWNKPHPKAENAKSIVVSAPEIYSAYLQNEQAANNLYLNKVVEVTGTLITQEKNQDGQLVAVIQAAPDTNAMIASGIMCTMREKDTNLPSGRTVTLKGFCTGYAGDVHLTDCIVAK